MCGILLDRTLGLFELHSLAVRNRPDKVVVVENFEAEADVRSHDAARAGRGQLQAITFLFSRFDRAASRLSPDPGSIDDEARAVEVGQFGKYDLIAFLREHELA